jgi:hypothetical protein
MRTILTLAAVFVVEPLFGFDAANAGPCIDQISQIEHVMQQPNVRPLAQQAVVARFAIPSW